MVSTPSWGQGWDARGSEGKEGMWPRAALSKGEDTIPKVLPPHTSLTSPALRFCGLIQALVTNPDSKAPAEEAEGVGEVLEVRRRNREI